jgi:hypothetical protein
MIPHLSHGSRIDQARVDLKRGFCFACRRGRSPKACKRLERRSIMGAVRATCVPDGPGGRNQTLESRLSSPSGRGGTYWLTLS